MDLNPVSRVAAYLRERGHNFKEKKDVGAFLTDVKKTKLPFSPSFLAIFLTGSDSNEAVREFSEGEINLTPCNAADGALLLRRFPLTALGSQYKSEYKDREYLVNHHSSSSILIPLVCCDKTNPDRLSIAHLLLKNKGLDPDGRLFHYSEIPTRNVWTPNQEGLTPLHIAASRGDLEMVQLLVSFGAKAKTWRDRHGKTPEQRAAANGYEEVVQFLQTNRIQKNVEKADRTTKSDVYTGTGSRATITAASRRKVGLAPTIVRVTKKGSVQKSIKTTRRNN
ncbi:hypothetical protein BKA67DRAFT_582377 [Truncatella angustata]|uniref:Uncharacterized protein n=1 Tax=Truncatella angustata TaxID=152316 RepID=A0A9P8RHA6_9PEZI|nr:uncharacterized protein BKA67DRAFT_582377 [Truncatella angustata]KAH6645794.1 hypothetical protein BKA67DRAFT_582377 [Truncatella angustata]